MPKREELLSSGDRMEYRLTWRTPSGQMSALYQAKRLARMRRRVLAERFPRGDVRVETRRVDPWQTKTIELAADRLEMIMDEGAKT